MGRTVKDKAWLPSRKGISYQKYQGYLPDCLEGWTPALSEQCAHALSQAEQAVSHFSKTEHDDDTSRTPTKDRLRHEAIFSSIIEGVRIGVADLVEAERRDSAGQPPRTQDEALTVGCMKQNEAAIVLGKQIRQGEPCNVEDLLRLHDVLFNKTRDRAIGGKLRNHPVWVGPPGAGIGAASFVGPPPDYLRNLLEDLSGYINSDHHQPCLQAALTHSQFETIHPFVDGNGRTGRALIQTVLAARGSIETVLPVSRWIEHNRGEYYAALNQARVICQPDDTKRRSRAVERWVALFFAACVEAAQNNISAYTRHRTRP